MDNPEIPDHYLTVEGRLASFHSTHPVSRRRSNAKGKAPKAIAWPHKRLDPANFARAGFYFDPTAESPDNVTCFLCRKALDGWTDDDDPTQEHVRHSPYCGWAIVAAIEAEIGDYPSFDPSHPNMMEARKATFAARWPHEGKKTWKCKIKQMVEAGWKYTPTIDSDDMATCTYCRLALDGWEPKDEPMNEHYNRSPQCPFFLMIKQYQAAPAKKTARGKGARTSKASRLSVQSVATFASEAPSLLGDPDDSTMTTTSVATAGGTKRGRAKMATTATAKGKKTRARKDEPVEVLADPPEEEDLPPPPPKPTRGRKRASDAVEDSGSINAEAPAPKKRTARTRRSNTADTSVIEPQLDVSMVDVAQPAPAKATRKGRASSARTTRKAPATSSAATASLQVAPEAMVDDEELDRQLLADLDRPLSDDELMVDSDSERTKAPAAREKGKKTIERKVSGTSFQETNDRSMFDPPAAVDSADVSAELSALRMEMDAEQAGAVQAPTKGHKTGSRKASKQTKKAEPAPQAEAQPQPAQIPVGPSKPHDDDVDELSVMNNTTVVTTSMAPAPKKRGRPKKNSTQLQPDPDALQSQAVAAEVVEPGPAPKKRGRPKKNSAQSQPDPDASQSEAVVAGGVESGPAPKKRGRPKKNSARLQPDPGASQSEAAAAEIVETSPEPPAAAPSAEKELPVIISDTIEVEAPTTPKASTSPVPAARQSVVSPSQSPQESDAENQPPSSRPSNAANSGRVDDDNVEPVAAITTPVRSSSPSKRNGTQTSRPRGPETTHPWASVDLDLVFEELGGEDTAGAGYTLDAEGARLSSPEKRMTVVEWIYHNANQAESRLQRECEAMVSRFETEGGLAMRALEGLVVAE